MKQNYICIVQSEQDLDFTHESKMTPEQRQALTEQLSNNSVISVCFGKMDEATFVAEWEKGTKLVNRDMELKADFAQMFKPIMESMIRQGVIITNPDGTYSQRQHSKALFINLFKDMAMHFFRNFNVAEEEANMRYLDAKKRIKDRHIPESAKAELQEIINNHEPSLFAGFEGMAIKKGLEMAIDKLPNMLKKGEAEPDIRLDPVEFMECFAVCNAFAQKWVAQMMNDNPEVEQMFKSLNIPFKKELIQPTIQIDGE